MRTFFFFLLTPFLLFSQQKLTLEEIWSGTFRENYLEACRPMNADSYSILNFDRTNGSSSIDCYKYATLKKSKQLLNSQDLPGISHFDSYRFDKNETKILISTQTQQIYRRSSKSLYFLYDLSSKTLRALDTAFVQEPTFSPNGERVAFVKENNLFCKNLNTEVTHQITNDGSYNKIINGLTDWVYEEEFAFVRAYEWNEDGSQIAYLKFDETLVPEYSVDTYNTSLYPKRQNFKYPKAGEKNAEVSLHVYNLINKSSKKIDLGDYEYIPHIQWNHDSNTLCAVTLNRRQNHLKLHATQTQNGTDTILLEEKDSSYIDVNDIRNFTFLKDNSFIWLSEKDGFNHLYHYSNSGSLKKQLTEGNWEVTKYYGLNEKTKTLFYQSVEDGNIHRTIYSIGLNGKNKKRHGPDTGTNSAKFSKDKTYFIRQHSDAKHPTSYTLHNFKKQLKEIKNNEELLEKLSPYNLPEKVFSTLKTKDGTFNMWTLKPINFNPSKEYPLLMIQYSGPGSQEVANSWSNYNDYWFYLLAQKGYILACIDGRGTGFKGAAFKKVTYKQLGKYEVIDQIEAAKTLRKLPYIDAERIGIWGWSYGAFMASNCLLKGNDVFQTAIAVAPVTSWRYYDSIYTERYMQTPQENPNGYDDNSPIFHVDKLKGNYLIVHGTGDDNVHVQNAYQMTNALIRANKHFEQAIYPGRTHGIYQGKNTRLHLFEKMTRFLEINLPSH